MNPIFISLSPSPSLIFKTEGEVKGTHHCLEGQRECLAKPMQSLGAGFT